MRALLTAGLLALSGVTDQRGTAPFITSVGTYCRVQAFYQPLFKLPPQLQGYFTLDNGMPALVQATIVLRPGCPPGGMALVGYQTGSRTIPDGYYMLTPDYPAWVKTGVPGYHTPVWHSFGGQDYVVPWRPLEGP